MRRSCLRRSSLRGASWRGCLDSSWCVEALPSCTRTEADALGLGLQEGAITLATAVQRESEKLVKDTSTIVREIEELHDCAFRAFSVRWEELMESMQRSRMLSKGGRSLFGVRESGRTEKSRVESKQSERMSEKCTSCRSLLALTANDNELCWLEALFTLRREAE